jgi:adenosylcobinamide-phosphate synthase
MPLFSVAPLRLTSPFSPLELLCAGVAGWPGWTLALAVLVALAVDRWLGEPRNAWHPVVWMGHYLGWVGRQIAPPGRVAASAKSTLQSAFQTRPFLLGALGWLLGAVAVALAAWWLQSALLTFVMDWTRSGGGATAGGLDYAVAALAAAVLGLLLKPLLAWSMLKAEVLAVEAALATEQGGSLNAGRERLRWLVSREVAQLSAVQVRESAIETLAENLNDSVVAPLFWFVLLGLPGAAVYRFANTADAMWGYHGVRHGQQWEWAGKWAARADDALSWLPARTTALLLLWLPHACDAAPGRPGTASRWELLRQLRQEAARTPSPNSGWPMAAMAMALGVGLHKAGVYGLNCAGRAPEPQDTQRAVACASNVVLALVLLAQAAIVFVATGVLR